MFEIKESVTVTVPVTCDINVTGLTAKLYTQAPGGYYLEVGETTNIDLVAGQEKEITFTYTTRDSNVSNYRNVKICLLSEGLELVSKTYPNAYTVNGSADDDGGGGLGGFNSDTMTSMMTIMMMVMMMGMMSKMMPNTRTHRSTATGRYNRSAYAAPQYGPVAYMPYTPQTGGQERV